MGRLVSEIVTFSAKNSSLVRPIILTIINATGVTVEVSIFIYQKCVLADSIYHKPAEHQHDKLPRVVQPRTLVFEHHLRELEHHRIVNEGHEDREYGWLGYLPVRQRRRQGQRYQ